MNFTEQSQMVEDMGAPELSAELAKVVGLALPPSQADKINRFNKARELLVELTLGPTDDTLHRCRVFLIACYLNYSGEMTGEI